MANDNKNRFPEQDEPNKQHGLHGSEPQKTSSLSESADELNAANNRTTEDITGQEKYLREIAKPEDAPGNGGEPVDENSIKFTDKAGEEKKEEYINTEERRADVERTIKDANRKRR